jgi:hypothetical protein
MEIQLKTFFQKKPKEYKLFSEIKKSLESLGEVESKVSKTQIAFKNKRQFAWVWLPMPWDKKRPKNCIILSFAFYRQIKNYRIVQSVKTRDNTWMHHIVIQAKSDIDGVVQKYLKQAYGWGKE